MSNPVLVILACMLCCCHKQGHDATVSGEQSARKSQYSLRVVRLNNEAMKSFALNWRAGNRDTLAMTRVIALLDSAISTDSSYATAYHNKASILAAAGRHVEAIRCMEVIVGRGQDHAEAVGFLGMLFEVQGGVWEARIYYKRSLSAYQERMSKVKILSDAVNEILMYRMLNMKDSADSRLAGLDAEFPAEVEVIRGIKADLKTFDRERYLKQVFQPKERSREEIQVRFLKSFGDYGELLDAGKRYRQYLESVKAKLPSEAFEFAVNDCHYDPSDHRCLHDSWLEELKISESSDGQTPLERDLTISVRLRGAYHDGFTTLVYKRVHGYRLDMAQLAEVGGRAHGDWMVDEITLSDRNLVLHEVHFSSGAIWTIECETMEYSTDIRSDGRGDRPLPV